MRNLGIDIGWTIKGNRATGNKDEPAPNSFDVIKNLHSRFDNIYFISKCNSVQKWHVEEWLLKYEVLKNTNVPFENLYFCFERKDKSIFAKALELTHFIDDRPEVMFHLPENIVKILFSPTAEDLDTYKGKLSNTIVTDNWIDVPRLLDIGDISKV